MACPPRRPAPPDLPEDLQEEENRLRLTMPLDLAAGGMLRAALDFNTALKAIEAAGWLGHPDRETFLRETRGNSSPFPVVTEAMFKFAAVVADVQRQDEAERAERHAAIGEQHREWEVEEKAKARETRRLRREMKRLQMSSAEYMRYLEERER